MTELIRQAVREWLARRGATQRKKRRATKNDEGRVFPFAVYPDLADLLARQWKHTSALQQASRQIIPRVCHRNGQPIKDFRKAWKDACTAAHVPGRIVHDFRRTAVRTLSAPACRAPSR